MVAYLVTFIYSCIVILRYYRGKPTVGLILAWMLVSPAISIGETKYSASYLFAVILLFAVVFKNPKIHRPHVGLREYLTMLLAINVLYVISWFLFNQRDPRTMFSTLCGGLKNILLLFICWEMNIENFKSALQVEISKMLRWMLIINVGFIILQMSFPIAMGQFFEQLFNDAQNANLEILLKSGEISRCFGLFGQATYLGVFALFSLTYILLIDVNMEKKEKFLYSTAAVFCGISSASKTFLFGSLTMLCAIAIGNLIRRKTKIIYIFVAVLAALSVLIIYIFSEQLYESVYNVFGGTAARPFLFIKDIGQIFATRFDLQKGSLISSGLIKVVKDNFLFGVGASSIIGEPAFDNAVLAILHNGGFICLGIVLWFFIKIGWKYRYDIGREVAILIILVSGMGFDTWTQPLSMWLILGIVFKSGNARGVAAPRDGIPLERGCGDALNQSNYEEV